MTKDKFYITTAIDYPNAEPHIGHAYQKIVADILARWNKVLGNDVWFLTGTDEHGKKIENVAKEKNKTPKELVDEVSERFKEAWKSLNIQPNRFIRTTDKDHEKLVQEIITKCNEKDDIYLGEYEGLYCTNCEAYYTEKDLTDGNCPVHNKPIEKLKEKSYFFRLSKYQKFLLDHYEKNPEFILPKERRNEIIARVKEGLRDLSISRTSFSWGIPFPLNKNHITYVWFDALFNYLSGAGKNKKYWPADVHLLGKDNSWFHCVYWPAFLKSANYKLPKTVFVHGFLQFNGQKISKSLGNAISPKVLAEKYGADTIRYFVCRQFPFASGDDGDFSEQALIDRHNNELANKLGNLISRTSGLIEKIGTEKTENSLLKKIDLEKIKSFFENYELDKILNEIFGFIDLCNEYIQNKKPWETKDKTVLYEIADSIKIIGTLLWPFIPETSEKIAKQFGFKVGEKTISEIEKQFNEKTEIKKSEILFNKIEDKLENKEHEKNKKTNKPVKTKENKIEGIIKMNEANFSDWEKINLRVAEIIDVEEIEGADKLYKLTLDVGEEIGERTICAGIKQFYSKKELKRKKIIYFANLTPRKMRGIESQGMLLAASNKKHDKVILISPEKEIENGAIIG